jgi:hypothetical protein
MMKSHINFNGEKFEVTEDDKQIHYKEISDRMNKAHFSFSKDPKENAEAIHGLRIFFTELFSN